MSRSPAGAVDALSQLGQGQRARLHFEDGSAVEVRVNQMEYVPGERLCLELTGDESGRSDRYRMEARVVGDGWTDPAVKRYDRRSGSWEGDRSVAEVVPLETFGTMKSDDMLAQARTGTEGRTTERE